MKGNIFLMNKFDIAMSAPRRYLVIFTASIFLFLSSSALGATYYVNNVTGSNANDGSSGAPWKEAPGTSNATSPTSGWVSISAGSTIIFSAGQTWTKPISISSSWYANPSSESGRITLQSSNPATKAIIDFSGQSNRSFMTINRNYITVRDFELRNSTSGYSGISITGDYNKILYNYIHDSGDAGSNFYVLELLDGTDHTEIAYNEIKNCSYKQISGTVNTSYTNAHHNTIHWEPGFSEMIEHGLVMGGSNHTLHANIIFNNSSVVPVGYMLKFDDSSSGASNCHDDKAYNNIIYGAPQSIGAMDCGGPTLFANNIIYAKNANGSCASSGCIHGIVIGSGGGGAANNTTVRNNIIYYVQSQSGGSHMIYIGTTSGTTITNNMFFHDSAPAVFRVDNSSGLSMSYMQSTWSGSNGNVFTNNLNVSPGFSGGSHTVSNLPTGFDSTGNPVGSGLFMLSTSSAINAGYDLSSYFSTDISGSVRPQGSPWDIGSYKFDGTTVTIDKIPQAPIINSIN